MLEWETSSACLLVPWTLLLWGLIWNRDSTLYYLKHVISLLLSQERLACFKTMWILKYDVFCLPTDSTIGCFCLTSIKNSGRKPLWGCICVLFCYLSSGIKTCSNRNHWQCKHIKGMDVEVLSGWGKQPESLTSEIWENCFSVLGLQSFPSHEIFWL